MKCQILLSRIKIRNIRDFKMSLVEILSQDALVLIKQKNTADSQLYSS